MGSSEEHNRADVAALLRNIFNYFFSASLQSGCSCITYDYGSLVELLVEYYFRGISYF
jgi:hypothetical protein